MLQRTLSEILLRVALFLAVLNIPGMHFTQHLALLAFYQVIPAGSPSYNHRRYFWAALYALSEALLKAQVARIQDSPVIALMMDSGTDISRDEHILIYVQYMVISPTQFKAVCEYLCTMAVAEKTAVCIYNTLKQVLEALGLSECRIAGFCADGGSEYAGKINGVGKKLQRHETGWLLRMHCFAHRAALVMNDQIKTMLCCKVNDNFTLNDVDLLMKDVHGLFSKSGSRKKKWARFVKTRKLNLSASFPVFNATRWFSHANCLQTLVNALPELILFLQCVQATKKPWGSSVLNRLRNPDMVALVMCVTDVVSSVNTFNQNLQKDGLLVFEAFENVSDITTRLNRLCTFGPAVHIDTKEPIPTGFSQDLRHGMLNLNTFLRSFDHDTGKWRYAHGRCVELVLSGAHLVGWDHTPVLHFSKGLVDEVVKSLEARFPLPTYVRALKVLHPKSWIGVMRGDPLSVSRKALFKVLLSFYSAGPNEVFTLAKQNVANKELRAQQIAKYMAEAELVGNLLSTLVTDNNTISMLDAWHFIYRNHALEVPHFLTCALSVLVCPVHSAAVERGFSIHRVLKHRLTSRLKLTTLDSAMRVKMLVKKEDIVTYDMTDAVAVYESSHPRNGQTPRLLAQLHRTVDEANTLPDKLSDGVDFADVGIDIDSESDTEEMYDPDVDCDNSDDDDDAWAAAGLDSEDVLTDLSEAVESEDVPEAMIVGSDDDA